MTYPSGGTPESAANYSSLATFAAKTEEDWTAELTDPVDTKATAVRDGLWADLPTGEGFGLTLLKELAKRILPLDAIDDWRFIEDVLVAIDGWAGDINALVGEVLQDLVDFFSNLLDRSGFLLILERVIEFFGGLGEGLDGFLEVLQEVIAFFAEILDRSGFLDVLQTVIEFFGGIVDGTLDTFLAVLKAIVEFFLGITDFTLETVFAILNDIVNFFGDLLDRSGFLDVLQQVIDFFAAAGGGALSTVLAALGDLVDWIITIVDRSGFLEVLGQVIGFFTNIADGVRDAFLDTVANVVAFFDSLTLDDFTLDGFVDALGAAVNRLTMGILPLDDIGAWVDANLIQPFIGMLTGDAFRLDLGAVGVWARNLLGRGDLIPAENLIGQISTALFGVIPLSSISNTQPNLLAAGAFGTEETVDPDGNWEWDGTQSHTGTGGSVKLTCNSQSHDLYSTQSIPVSQGDKVALSAWVKTAGFAGSGSPIVLSLIPFIGVAQQTAVTFASTGAQASWAQIGGGSWTVPADVTSVRVRLAVTNNATAGTVNFDDIYLSKTGLLQQSWVERLVDAWNNFWHGIFGGVLPQDKDVDDVYTAAAAVSSTASTAHTNASSALSQLGTLIWNLLNAPAAALGSIATVVMDGIATVGTFLSDLWAAFTGGTGTNKKVSDVKTAAGTVTSTANTASTTASTAATNANTAINTANTASTTASTAQSTANTASTNATTAVNTANTASTNATTAVNTANTASTNATTAVNTANTASTNATTAVNTANTASTNATTAVNTANTTSTNLVATNNAIYNSYYGSGGSGTASDVASTITDIKSKLNGEWTIQVITTSGTWTRPWSTGNEPGTFWAIAIGSGSGGGAGFSGITGAPGGEGGVGGRWLSKQIDPASITATVSVSVAAGGAGRTAGQGITTPNNGADSAFGSYCVTNPSITASVASFMGYYSCEDSRPGTGGAGGDEGGGAEPGSPGEATPLATGGGAGSANGGAGGVGGTASLTGVTRAGGGGGGGGGSSTVGTNYGGAGGAGGFPGGGGGGGGGCWNASSTRGGAGGAGGNGAVVLLWQ